MVNYKCRIIDLLNIYIKDNLDEQRIMKNINIFKEKLKLKRKSFPGSSLVKVISIS